VLILLAFIFASTVPAWHAHVRVPEAAVAYLGERLSAVDTRSPSSPPPLAWGIEIYAITCAACHSSGRDDLGIGARDHRPLAQSSPRDIFEIITWGRPRSMPSGMAYSGNELDLRKDHPAFPAGLTESERWAVATYVCCGGLDPGLGGTETEWLKAWEDRLQGGDVADSPPALYSRLCSTCHGRLGYGNGPLARDLVPPPTNLRDVPWLMNQSDRYLFAVIRDGMPNYPSEGSEIDPVLHRSSSTFTGMPWWGDYLDDDAIWSLVDYIRSWGYCLEPAPTRPGELELHVSAEEMEPARQVLIPPDSNLWTWLEIQASLSETSKHPPSWLEGENE
jgi:mono/diheme cytochrome c family protein